MIFNLLKQLHSNNHQPFQHIYTPLLLGHMLVSRVKTKINPQWGFLQDNLSWKKSIQLRCFPWLRVEWNFTKRCLARNIRSRNMIKYTCLSSILEPWKMLDASLFQSNIWQEVKKRPLIKECMCRLQIFMSWPIIGSVTWSPWSGGTTSGLMKVLLLIWAIWLWIAFQNSNISRVNGKISWPRTKGKLYLKTLKIRLILLKAKLRQLMMLSLFLMAFHMEKELHSWNSSTMFLVKKS